MKSDGSDVQALRFANLPAGYQLVGLSWPSGLGAFVVTLADAQNQEDLFLADRDGKIRQRLTSGARGAGDVDYSLINQQLAFVCQGQELDICVVGLDGQPFRNLTLYPSRDGQPRWSPDGRRILFVSTRSVVPGLWTIHPDGTEFIQLGRVEAPQGSPSWSPDGQRVVFESQRDGNWELYVMDADGKNPRNITLHPADDQSPKWSPDGQWILFKSMRNGGADLYIVRMDGTELVKLTQTPTQDELNFIWSPDSARVYYSAVGNGQDSEIFVVNRDGSGWANLTNNPADDVDPQWFESGP
jgi:TolB protein